MKCHVTLIFASAALCCLALPNARAQGEQNAEQASFPQGVAVSELTPEQKEQAQKLLAEAVTIYDGILDDKNEGKREYLQSNLAFVTERMEKMRQELKTRKAAMAELDREVMEKEKAIDSMDVSDKEKEAKKVQLVGEFEDRQETLGFRIGMIERHVANLEKRESAIRAEMRDLQITPEQDQLTEADKARIKLDQHRRNQQEERFRKYE